MTKRYCDRCGQQIDEGVHAWYVLELHGTDGEFRHKELCEECYEYLCEKDEAPKADRKTEPTHDLRTKTHECVKDTHDKTSPNSSEKPNNSTISKMEQVEDEPLTCSFSDCDNFKNPDYARCIECKRKQIELKTEPNSSEIPTGSTTEDCSVVEERSSE